MSTLLRARIRLDVTSMLLRRRRFNSDRWHSQPRRSSKLTPHRSLGERFLVQFGYIQWRFTWILSWVPLVFLGYGHVACIDMTMALLLPFKTFEDVLLSIRSTTTDINIKTGIPSIDNVLSQFAAVIMRSVSGTFQAYSRLLRRCVHVHDWHHLWTGVIKCAFEADECWPSTLKKSRDLPRRVFFVPGFEREVDRSMETFTASLAQWRFDTSCVVFEQLCKLRSLI